MIIAIYSEYFYPHVGGQEIKYFNLGKELVKRGHNIEVFTICDDMCEEKVLDGIHVYKLINIKGYGGSGYRTIKDLLFYLLLTKLQLKKVNKFYDVVIVNQMPMSHLVTDFRKKFLSKVFVLDMVEYWKMPYLGLLYRHVIKMYDGFLALNYWVYKFLISLLGSEAHRKRICFFPPGIDTSKYSARQSDKETNFLLYVGRLTKHKNLDLILYTMKYLKSRGYGSILHIVGTGPEYRRLIKLTDLLGIKQNVVFHGLVNKEKLIKLFKKAFIFLLPSIREGYSISALEAMAASTPVITCDYKNNYTKDLVRFSNSGIVSIPNPIQLALHIIKLSNNYEQWKLLSYNALKFSSIHDIRILANRLELFLNTLIESRN